MRSIARILLIASFVSLSSCGNESTSTDGARPDASVVDSRSLDVTETDRDVVIASDTTSQDDGAPSRDAATTDATTIDIDDAGPVDPPPAIAVGADAFRAWADWPTIAVGARVYMRSTYDRSGGNENADASHFLRAETDRHITLDVNGRGFVNFVRTNHWHGSPWLYRVDGNDVVVAETSTANPNAPVDPSTFIPPALFPPPMALTWSTTHGADLSWVPIGFESSFAMGYGRTFYGTGYYIYSLFADDTPTSQPIRAWDGATAPPADVVLLIARAGEDIAPTGTGVGTDNGSVDVPGAGAVTLWSRDGAATVRALKLRIAKKDAIAFGKARLRVTWNDREAPSIEAPIALFFGAGTLFNRNNAEWLVRSFPSTIHFDPPVDGPGGVVELATYFPMPFEKSARIEIVSAGLPLSGVGFEVRTVPLSASAFSPSWQGLFHATYRDHGTPTAGVDLTLLDTSQDEPSSAAWCGSFVGTSFTFSDRAFLATLEGDPRFYFDDALSPQAYGTGTEEWGGGGDYWGGQTMSLAFAGHPVGAPSLGAADARNPTEDTIESAYRYLLADRFYFGKNARITLEHGGANDTTEHYQTVTYWYGRPGACLVETDAMQIGVDTAEAAHGYSAANRDGSLIGVDTVTSRYEWGADHLGSVEFFPAVTRSGRHHAGTSAFTVRLDPSNFGALLRRTLDYQWPNQNAEVYVSEDRDGAPFERVGIWYLAGSNTCVSSYPAGETLPPSNVVQTSNRRLREDEFLLPRRVTAGRSSIRIKIVQVPTGVPLLAGDAVTPEAWSEIDYRAFSYVAPR
jgi:hypothetical protein